MRVLDQPSGELGPEDAKEFRDTGKYGGEEDTQQGAELSLRRMAAYNEAATDSRAVSGVIPEHSPRRGLSHPGQPAAERRATVRRLPLPSFVILAPTVVRRRTL